MTDRCNLQVAVILSRGANFAMEKYAGKTKKDSAQETNRLLLDLPLVRTSITFQTPI